MTIPRRILIAAWVALPFAGACMDSTIDPGSRQIGALRTPGATASPPGITAVGSPTPTPRPAQSNLAGNAETGTPLPGASPAPTPKTVDRVLLTPREVSLNLPAAAGAASVGIPTSRQFTAFVFFGDGTSDSDVIWTIQGSAALVSATGLVSAAAKGTSMLIATSRTDPARTATAAVTVRDDGTLGLTLD